MLGIVLIILACFVWALDTLIRYPLMGQGFSAENIVFIEHLFLTLFMIPALIKSREKFINIKLIHFFDFLVIGCFGSAIATIAFTKAFIFINPSIVILLQKLQPIIAIFLARLILKETIKEKFLIWALVCFVGGLMIAHNDLIPALKLMTLGESGRATLVEGYILALVAVLGWAMATVFGKKLSLKGFSATEIMAGRFSLALVSIGIGFVLFSWQLTLNVDLPNLGKILIMVLISGLLGMYLYYKGLKLIPAKLCALCEMFFPMCAVLINWFFLDATLDIWQIIGACVLLLGSFKIQISHY